MYYSSKILIDPSQVTLIKKEKPNKAFGKVLNRLTMGAVSKKVEEETFTAVSILQQINYALKSRNINNLIRLAVDDVDFYFDRSGIKSDLDAATWEFGSTAGEEIAGDFQNICLVLEHDQPSFKYIIDTRVSRQHEIKQYPIEIIINGLFADFAIEDNIEEKIENAKNDNEFLEYKDRKFRKMIQVVCQGIEKHLEIDDLKSEIMRKTMAVKSDDDPAFKGYYGIDKYLKYLELW